MLICCDYTKLLADEVEIIEKKEAYEFDKH